MRETLQVRTCDMSSDPVLESSVAGMRARLLLRGAALGIDTVSDTHESLSQQILTPHIPKVVSIICTVANAPNSGKVRLVKWFQILGQTLAYRMAKP